MEVLKYLNDKAENCFWEHALNSLKTEFGIKVSYDERFPELVVLNYDQIESSKHKEHPIVRECRSLVLHTPSYDYDDDGMEIVMKSNFSVASRAFDRFFNLTETSDTQLDNLDFSKMVCYEKLDGSLISVWHDNKHGWLYRTKSMIMPLGEIMGTSRTWKDLIESTTGFPEAFDGLNKDYTYIFEVCGRENRVVVKYDMEFACLLAVRGNDYGGYHTTDNYKNICSHSNWRTPDSFAPTTSEACTNKVETFGIDAEGVVAYLDGVPVCKVKSPAYLAAHRMRGNGVPSTKRIMDLIFMNEHEEYLSVFPEDRDIFNPYIYALKGVMRDFNWHEGWCRSIEDQKEFALAIKDFAIAPLLFKKRKNLKLTFNEILSSMNTNTKYNIVEKFL